MTVMSVALLVLKMMRFPRSLSSSKLTALVCYTTPAELEGGGADVVAVAMDDNTVQAFTTDVSQYTFYCTIAEP